MPAVLPLPEGLQPETGAARYRLDEADWQPLVLGNRAVPGYYWIPLPSDSRRAWQAYWMKLDPGARGPRHFHPSTELVQVFQGDFRDAGGAQYGPGDVVVYEEGSGHSTWSVKGCIVLVVASVEAVVDDEPV